MIVDTICDATQERQDAVTDLVGKQEQVRPRKGVGCRASMCDATQEQVRPRKGVGCRASIGDATQEQVRPRKGVGCRASMSDAKEQACASCARAGAGLRQV